MKEIDYSPSLLASLKIAKTMANHEKHATYGVAHVVMAMFIEPTGLKEILESLGKDAGYIAEWFEVRKEMYTSEVIFEGDIEQDDALKKVIEEAERSKIKLGTDTIDAVCVFTAIVREGVVYSKQQIDSLGIKEEDILNQYNVPKNNLILSSEGESELVSSALFAINLKTEKIIKEGALVLGREKEVRSILENLERSENKGTLLVGDSGVGKTAVINAFVKELSGNQDDYIQNTLIFGLNVPKLLANSTSENDVSKKIVELFENLNKLENQCILVIDDLQVLLENSSGKSNMVSNVLNAQLNDGAVNLIFTITSDAYRKNLEKHPIKSKLEIVQLEELEHFVLVKCLEKHKERLENHSEIKISEKAMEETIHLSKRYFKEKKLPYGAIDLLDRTVAAVKMSNHSVEGEVEKLREQFQQIIEEEVFAWPDLHLLFRSVFKKVSVVVTSKLTKNYVFLEEDTKEVKIEKTRELLKELAIVATEKITVITPVEIEAIVADLTGIPIGKIQAEEKERLLGIETKLQERVKGQDNAIVTLSDAIIESRSGLSNPKQPIGSFFFLGPTGTGKTELTKSLAELLFDDENAMIRFDMSEFKEEHSAALLYGAPPGYVGYEEGGMLVNKIREKPYAVVLFDEIEKAHSSVYDVFLQIMDEGTIHDKLGRSGDFSNAIIIFTSNIGSQWIAEQMEKGIKPSSNELIEVMAQHFRPEFLGRLTEVVPFAPIDEKVARDIFKLHFAKLQAQLKKQKNIRLNLSEEALGFLAKKGYSKKYGARPIAGVIRTYIKKVVSKFIVSEQVKNGEGILLDYKDEQLIWEQC
ncbi:AAA family ATPase [Tenacibaculum maritimum]|uniref:AAA family ATPase n=1 Tax=Tenacibaculum maritimum TaxID=107401 RepID=UPI001E2F82F0|nr:ATP-dependent Clp protease ATP-binding subunit [Tenacibaculum maritimum]MCD9583846.1 ATP-dependent Clp protease ATP-binding subunit [Tenacibaculum maritimum]MCD9620596.1 ATP-dependent Clp protease ATP-binding subunit [Tenacibaculum maritimum]MCD9626557.1 ATP-dependent Clp protease ATP-binding subunit [Tenacibaculum maritimum]MCD9629271.1 ATP-dependent Clp protease ATP-binding subunit [Tenacibaculum maritimum]MCD9632034.1 ATP-dependent Clp protease ATP-binding subunit [Tenacibaculum maritimu